MYPVHLRKKNGSLQKDSEVIQDSTTSSYLKSPVGIVTFKDAATHYECRWNFISGCCSANRDGESIKITI
uniref:ZP domain-containing protein n=1 Tax=Strongyloides venezuelensis TaxID=75913 RepID=A0A0K0F989_STRVS